ncbi:MAG TPA: signal recognition particle protein, partial [Desulfobacterales bacterium]|nr:signal recognition particle protein [Desulfobacterales bacterium]
KLALKLRRDKRSPLLVPADVYRPAAIEQLQILGRQLDIPVFASRADQDPVVICREAHAYADRNGYDTLILDTAGRLHIDETLMQELVRIRDELEPREILLVADAMTGQDAVAVAQNFHEALDLTGVILTKVEGDARGGAALSMRTVVNKPIKFLGVGEKLDALEVFHPDRLASRILGMGDVLTLIEKAQDAFDADQAKELERKLRKETFTLEDFRDQLRQVRKMGSLDQLMGMIPGLNKIKGMKDMQPDEKELVRIEAIINSMTPAERANHVLIDGSRRRRIAKGSGVEVQDVNRLLKNFTMTQKMMKKMIQAGKKGGKRRFLPFGL